MRLKTHTKTPPGLYPYEQTEGIRHKFPKMADINDQARVVADFRLGNNLPRATFAEALEDVDEYQCLRLGGNTEWCKGSDKPYAEVTPKLRKKSCSGCGAKVK